MTEQIEPSAIGLWYELNGVAGTWTNPHAGRYDTYLERLEQKKAATGFYPGASK